MSSGAFCRFLARLGAILSLQPVAEALMRKLEAGEAISVKALSGALTGLCQVRLIKPLS